ncbi:hypothetical protein [Tenacibaculum agarivorans]|uniref:hypothetical protein n=1 Tax=Tenacibaculum agarivorans TaxID=1908389 RepID=UPI00094B8189|nr:hypothetical protein [Tenacibaculum agarivorans]
MKKIKLALVSLLSVITLLFVPSTFAHKFYPNIVHHFNRCTITASQTYPLYVFPMNWKSAFKTTYDDYSCFGVASMFVIIRILLVLPLIALVLFNKKNKRILILFSIFTVAFLFMAYMQYGQKYYHSSLKEWIYYDRILYNPDHNTTLLEYQDLGH